ncbi:hypothetical protein Nepgr_019184 [Nepenthes gracilis]|uniref:Uncharacterized protein n=1 Tax=Nepenthes gracilis TaxID=150966 RepID=A0AAD3SSS0_NEPGR|nr:hypothetical protein Nepgr_019184 [Nepenthes gracilis]
MAGLSACRSWMTPPASVNPATDKASLQKPANLFTASAAKAGEISLNSAFKRCQTCGGQGAIECPGCKGTGKNKKNGNIFERWKCFDCQGFGLKSCPKCGKGGLTPEQRGER